MIVFWHLWSYNNKWMFLFDRIKSSISLLQFKDLNLIKCDLPKLQYRAIVYPHLTFASTDKFPTFWYSSFPYFTTSFKVFFFYIQLFHSLSIWFIIIFIQLILKFKPVVFIIHCLQHLQPTSLNFYPIFQCTQFLPKH